MAKAVRVQLLSGGLNKKETMDKQARTTRAFSRGCVGCQRHEKDVMIALQDIDDYNEMIWNDWFLNTDQAERLHEELGRVLEENKKAR